MTVFVSIEVDNGVGVPVPIVTVHSISSIGRLATRTVTYKHTMKL